MSRKCPNCGREQEDSAFVCEVDGSVTLQVQSPSDVDPRIGKKLGEYILAARVADGAMGRVYEGIHAESHKRVAIKVLHAQVAEDEVSVERFKREFETAEALDHPNIVRVHDFGSTPDGSLFMTMEYLEGEELSLLLSRGIRLRPERLVRIVCQVALALREAHAEGVVHRDLKPDNVFLCRGEGDDETVRILDFGSVKLQLDIGAKLTALGSTLGSPYYMSPEQAMGRQDVDQRSDVFALSAITFEMATGKVPFEGSSIAEILMKVVNEDPPAPSSLDSACTFEFDDVVLRALHKDKAQRPEGTVEFAGELLSAYGIDARVETVAAASLEEIGGMLAGAERKSHVYGDSVPVAQVAEKTAETAARRVEPAAESEGLGGEDIEESLRIPESNRKFLLYVAIGVLAVVGVAIALSLR